MFPSTAVEWLSKLVSFDTTSAKSNLEVVNYIAEFYKSFNVKHILYYNEDKTKASILAKIEGQYSSTQQNINEGGVMLNGHLDCVPVIGQKWQTDPFTATQIKDRIYGRGTCDMKGFISVCLSMLPSLVQSPPIKPVYFAWTYDEEVGCIGGKQLAEIIKAKQIHVDGCVVGEPTSNKVVVAHKGICVWKVCIRGKACHSSFALTDKGCNAIEYASRLVIAIRDIAENMKKFGDRDKYYDTEFTTMSANIIQGGNAINTVPEYCEVLYEFRNLPTMAQDDIQQKVEDYINTKLLPALQAECKEGTITIQCMASVPSFRDIDENQEFVKLMRKLTNDYEFHKLGCTTEAGQYALIDIPVVVCGPGSIKVAHQQDEYVPVVDLENCEKIIRWLISSIGNKKCKL